MQSTTIVVIVAILALSTLACGVVGGVRGSGNVVTETRKASNFTGVKLASFGNLHSVQPGTTGKVQDSGAGSQIQL